MNTRRYRFNFIKSSLVAKQFIHKIVNMYFSKKIVKMSFEEIVYKWGGEYFADSYSYSTYICSSFRHAVASNSLRLLEIDDDIYIRVWGVKILYNTIIVRMEDIIKLYKRLIKDETLNRFIRKYNKGKLTKIEEYVDFS